MSDVREYLMGVLQTDVNDYLLRTVEERHKNLCRGVMKAIRLIDREKDGHGDYENPRWHTE